MKFERIIIGYPACGACGKPIYFENNKCGMYTFCGYPTDIKEFCDMDCSAMQTLLENLINENEN